MIGIIIGVVVYCAVYDAVWYLVDERHEWQR